MNRILLLLENRANRKLLGDWLKEKYTVLFPEDGAPKEGYDLGIVDGVALERHWVDVRKQKEVDHPVFLPFLFVASKKDVSILTRHLWRTIDELIYTPIDKAELQARVEIMLRARGFSVELEHRYHTIAEKSSACIYVLRDGKIVYANPVLLKRLETTMDALSGRSHRMLFDPADHERIDGYIAGAATLNGDSGDSLSDAVSFRVPGGECWVELHATPILYFDKPASLVMALDVTEQQRMHRELQHSEQELRKLSSKLLTAQESERKLVAMDLHDTVAQSLTATKMGLEMRLAAIRGQRSSGPSLETIISSLQDNIDEVRRIMQDLWPRSIEEIGVIWTIEKHCGRMQAIYPELRIEKFYGLQEEEIPGPLKIVIFRIIQESLNNVGKHSRADRAEIRLEKEEGQLLMTVQDNGLGFDPENLPDKGNEKYGIGLSSMRERAHLSGGTLLILSGSILSGEGRGTTIAVRWPLSE